MHFYIDLSGIYGKYMGHINQTGQNIRYDVSTPSSKVESKMLRQENVNIIQFQY